MDTRLAWRQSIEFRTPLSVEECRQRLTMRNSPAEYDFIDNPGTFGVLGPSEFSVSRPRASRRRWGSYTHLQGQLTPAQDHAFVRLRDTTPRAEFVLQVLSIVVLLAALGLYSTTDVIPLALTAVMGLSTAIVATSTLRLFRQRQREAHDLMGEMLTLLDGKTTQPGALATYVHSQGDSSKSR